MESNRTERRHQRLASLVCFIIGHAKTERVWFCGEILHSDMTTESFPAIEREICPRCWRTISELKHE